MVRFNLWNIEPIYLSARFHILNKKLNISNMRFHIWNRFNILYWTFRALKMVKIKGWVSRKFYSNHALWFFQNFQEIL